LRTYATASNGHAITTADPGMYPSERDARPSQRDLARLGGTQGSGRQRQRMRRGGSELSSRFFFRCRVHALERQVLALLHRLGVRSRPSGNSITLDLYLSLVFWAAPSPSGLGSRAIARPKTAARRNPLTRFPPMRVTPAAAERAARAQRLSSRPTCGWRTEPFAGAAGTNAEDRPGLTRWWHGARPVKARPGSVESASASGAAAGLDSALRAVPARPARPGREDRSRPNKKMVFAAHLLRPQSLTATRLTGSPAAFRRRPSAAGAFRLAATPSQGAMQAVRPAGARDTSQ
jgi:hypothetical protein